MTRNIFVTNALPYANGPIHLGHLVGYVQADIWVRFQRIIGNHVVYVCADDAHGTPIMLAARAARMAPEAFIAEIKQAHQRDFDEFGVVFDHYHSTHSEENRWLAEHIYSVLVANGLITNRNILQAYDPAEEMFLPDRYVRGVCPSCDAADQYGDNCEICGATYSARELKDPVSTLSGTVPEWRPSKHYFFMLSRLQEVVEHWLATAQIHPAVKAKLREWTASGLKDWDISRDAPYFGFAIPGAPGKYFYVWLDAPIGYFASLLAHLKGDKDALNAYIGSDSTAEMWHFIGKDIVNFHGLFWPALLHGAHMRQPTGLSVNGYLTVNGSKMSKSRGTFIKARSYINSGLDPEYLRYYFAAKLSPGVDDIDLNLQDFAARVNSDLVGKYVNIASRCATFVEKRFNGQLGQIVSDREFLEHAANQSTQIALLYESREFAGALRAIMTLADQTNEAIQRVAPWVIAKDAKRNAELQAVCTTFLNVFRLLTLYLKPVLPKLAIRAEAFLNVPPLEWSDVWRPLLAHAIQPYRTLITRIDPVDVTTLVRASKEDLAPTSNSDMSRAPAQAASGGGKQPELVNVDDYEKIELRVARIENAEEVEGSEKLLRLTLDLGNLGKRQVLAGIKSHYAPDALIGRLTVLVANLAPRTMRFGVSQGMVIVATRPGGGVYLVSPDAGAEPGMIIR